MVGCNKSVKALNMKINDKSSVSEYSATPSRYDEMKYKRCGKSGLKLPALSLGLWHNFGFVDNIQNSQQMLRAAFDLGITHFDLANNYGPPYGSAEETLGILLKKDFTQYRDELIISTKAGYDMWPGPYGAGGSRKYLISSLDQSLKRMGLDYVDIYYHHSPDPEVPVEESMLALADIVRKGKALYVGISNYSHEGTAQASRILKELKIPFVIHQAKYNIFDRWVEDGLLDTLQQAGLGCIAFSPLAQGLLTNKYLNGIPKDSRAAKNFTFLEEQDIESNISKIIPLAELAKKRGQTLSQMSIAWLLNRPAITSVLIGSSSPEQLKENVKALDQLDFSEQEMTLIDQLSL